MLKDSALKIVNYPAPLITLYWFPPYFSMGLTYCLAPSFQHGARILFAPSFQHGARMLHYPIKSDTGMPHQTSKGTLTGKQYGISMRFAPSNQ